MKETSNNITFEFVIISMLLLSFTCILLGLSSLIDLDADEVNTFLYPGFAFMGAAFISIWLDLRKKLDRIHSDLKNS